MQGDIQVALMRWRAALGVRGLLGGMVAALAVSALAMAWRLHLESLHIEQRINQLAHTASTPAQKVSGRVVEADSLPYSSQQTSILRQIEASAQKLNLAWSKVDYSHQDMSDSNLASMDIKGVMKGPYPALRDFLAEVLSEHPSTALRSLVLTRDAAENADVEARINFSIFLADGWHPPGPASSSPP